MNFKINSDLKEKLEKHLQETSFRSLDELVEFVLMDYLKQFDSPQKEEQNDDQELNKRLKDLGYF